MDNLPRLYSLVDNLLDGDLPKNQPELVAAAEKLLATTPAYEKPTKIRTTADTFKDFKLQAIHVSTLLQVPKESLEHGGCLDHQKTGLKIYYMMENVTILVSHYLLKFREDRSESDIPKPTNVSKLVPVPDTSNTPKGGYPTSSRIPQKRKNPPREKATRASYEEVSNREEEPVHVAGGKGGIDNYYVGRMATRDNNQKKACRKRDGFHCIFMGTSLGEVAHIIPFSWNKNEANIGKTGRALQASEAFFSDTTCTELT
ncbi:hypothetical protein FSPOR_4236 [Fusarium sporotrichioides]|uniref:HNH nuclease domain-containing protein n=1 Tax=Fusarium sporotrichioides TaxID=5514 RepID=A0A395SCI2_FUSSP|nr:hypothetical protein FSPOR_4236 [Fusarium sporotrichioides]